MPPVNQAVIASAGVIAISVAVAAAIAVYESPELRRMADDLRRRIAIALHSLGDNVHPTSLEPMFNRPEDAEGFLRSRGVVGNEAGVDADDETRRRQREELMYWNAIREQKKEMERREAEALCSSRTRSRGSTFDDFLQQDTNADRGTYVFNTGASIRGNDDGVLRRRGVEGVRGLSTSIYANPFADEHGIDDFDEQPVTDSYPLTPGRDELMSDIYNATEPDQTAASRTLSPHPPAPEVLLDFASTLPADSTTRPVAVPVAAGELVEDEYMTAGQDGRSDAYASIQAWAQNSSNPGFYSPLPVSPPAPLSEPEIISEGAVTPTDSASTVGSGEDVGNDAVSSRAGDHGRFYDVMSDDEDGIPTPVSWTEVGSVVSESDGAVYA